MAANKTTSLLTAPRTVCVLSALLLVMLGASAQTEVAPAPCSSIQLRKILRDRPPQPKLQRGYAAALSAGLSCSNISEYPIIAAAAAYELSQFYADLAPPDVQRAIEYRRKSAELLRATDERKLWFETSLVVAQMQASAARDIDALAEARKGLQDLEGVVDASWAADVAPGYYYLLAQLNESIFEGDDASARVPALEAFKRFLGTEAGRAQTIERASALEASARLLVSPEPGEAAWRAAYLDRAVAAFDEAIALYRKLGSWDDRQRTQVKLAAAYVSVEGARNGDNVEKGIEILKSALNEINPRLGRGNYINAANNLGGAFMERQAGEPNQNMLEAVRWLKVARNQLDPKQPDERALWVRSSINLVLALMATDVIDVSDISNLQEAENILTETITWLEESKQLDRTVKPLALQARIRLTLAGLGNNLKQLDEAGALLAKAEARSAHLPAALRANLLADRGEYLRYRFMYGDAHALDQAIAAYRGAIALANRRESPSIWAAMQNALGNVCSARARPDLYQCAFDAYQQALLVWTEAAMPKEHSHALANLAGLEFENANWQQAAEFYSSVARHHREIVATIVQREILLTSASQSKRWFERAAYALAKQGRAEEGLWIAEQGKTRLLKRRLGLKDLTDDVAQRNGMSGTPAAAGTLVLVPIVSTKGGLVFALFRSPQGWVIRTVFLNGLDAGVVETFMTGGRQAGGNGGWLGAYQEMVRQTASGESFRQPWDAKLRECQAWLGARLVQPVFAALKAEGIEPTTVAWVLQGELATLPIHAALMGDGRTLVEHLPVMYSPSLLLLHRPPGTPLPRQPKDLRLVTVGNPTSDPALLFAEVEARSAFSRLAPSRARLLTSGRATAASVKQALRRAEVFHFAGHASFSRKDPQKSHLLLANTQRLAVADLQEVVGATGPDLVILSACESGLIQVYDIANEFQGFPATFLGLGARGVVSTLWPVDDGPTLFLVDRLMDAKFTRNRPIPEALREAQLWLKEARGEELAKVARRLSGLTQDPASKAGLTRLIWLFEHKPEWQPYSDPAHWAGFFYSGRDLYEIDK